MKRVLILGALLTAILAPPVSAQTTQQTISFGLGGLTVGQTARLNVAFLPSEPFLPGEPFTLRFLNASDQPVLNADGFPVEQQVQIAPGASAFLDLRGSLLVAGRDRAQIRPVVLARPRAIKNALLSA